MSDDQNINISDEAKNFLNSDHQLLINGSWVKSKSSENYIQNNT